ncbi:hypothetical protein [uncultured Brevundimonas sp.]|uniref:hypothetical protein n=1 Tax=uncultured Brevundimonas sp. TaxID=213418 RepID=UPI000F9E2786|nr:hypothetical protein [uncultured Brevundimonas sp.]
MGHDYVCGISHKEAMFRSGFSHDLREGSWWLFKKDFNINELIDFGSCVGRLCSLTQTEAQA